MRKPKLTPQLHAEAIRRLRHSARMPARYYSEPNPTQRALDLRAWLAAAGLNRYGFSVGLDQNRQLVAIVGKKRILLEQPHV